MPEGTANFVAAALILTLKLWLLPRFLLMPAMLCYLSASAVETACYLLGWRDAEWAAAVNVLGALAAIEAPAWALGVQSDRERSEVRRWCWMLGLLFVAATWMAIPVTYPSYNGTIYAIRLYASVMVCGFLVGMLGYCWANSLGIPRYVIHASILLLRLATFVALLLVHDRSQWFTADLVGEAVNILTLGAWLWLIPAKRGIDRRKMA